MVLLVAAGLPLGIGLTVVEFLLPARGLSKDSCPYRAAVVGFTVELGALDGLSVELVSASLVEFLPVEGFSFHQSNRFKLGGLPEPGFKSICLEPSLAFMSSESPSLCLSVELLTVPSLSFASSVFDVSFSSSLDLFFESSC